eukprot:scaffold38715_cov31-Tisochrysis_lutea.AAC.6
MVRHPLAETRGEVRYEQGVVAHLGCRIVSVAGGRMCDAERGVQVGVSAEAREGHCDGCVAARYWRAVEVEVTGANCADDGGPHNQ